MTSEASQGGPGPETMGSPPEAASDDARRQLAALEAVLFMAAEPITAAELAEILEVGAADLDQLASLLGEEYRDRGIQVTRVAGGYQVCTRPEYGPYVARLHKPERFRLSRAALETLAIVAYRQPITRPEIEAIRGVNSDSPIDTLGQYELICEAGRKDSPGRPMLYRTTDNFLGQFGLNSVDDLPSIESPPADEQAVRAQVGGADETSKEAGVAAGEQPPEQTGITTQETPDEGIDDSEEPSL